MVHARHMHESSNMQLWIVEYTRNYTSHLCVCTKLYDTSLYVQHRHILESWTIHLSIRIIRSVLHFAGGGFWAGRSVAPRGRQVRGTSESTTYFSSHDTVRCVWLWVMSPQRSRRKKLRDKRRLLSFIMRKRSKGEEVEIDYWQMCIDLKETNFLNDIAIDLKKHSEQRYFSLICTVQRPRHSLYSFIQ